MSMPAVNPKFGCQNGPLNLILCLCDCRSEENLKTVG